ncbi:MAG: sulfatase [Gemmatimonadaceae bacterium]|nr:sulfatase [Gemmatimonadaceae bacterium]
MRILYLDLDALNPRHLSCYGYHRNTSPAIDAVAAEGLRCTNVYTPDAPCLPSRTAFYQGRFGIQTGVVGHGGTAADPKREGWDRGFRSCYEEASFPRLLQKSGLHTAMISPFGQRHAAHQFYAGFNEIHNTGQGGMEPVAVVQPVVDRWLDQHAAEGDWYLHVNYWDIHTPYRTPDDYGNPFVDDPVSDLFTDELIEAHVQRYGPHSAQDLGMYTDNNTERFPRLPLRITDGATLKQWLDGYDVAIRYVDDQIATIVGKLKAAGVYDDTAIIISADHGENQGELGIYGEHATADAGTCRIPMVVKWPGGVAGAVDEGFHYNIDWAPTCLELFGSQQPVPDLWDGQSYAATVQTGAGPGRHELVVSQCCHVCQRSVRFDRWMYVRTYCDGFHPFAQDMLFDLEADPLEQDDVAAKHPEVVREGAYRLMNWHDAQMQKMAVHCSDSVDPLWTVVREGGPHHALHDPERSPLPKYLQRLEATGRASGAAELRRKYPNLT